MWEDVHMIRNCLKTIVLNRIKKSSNFWGQEEMVTKFSGTMEHWWGSAMQPSPSYLINHCWKSQINHLSLHLERGLFWGLPDYICLKRTPRLYWYLTKISCKLMINLCNPACSLKMACLSLRQRHKRGEPHYRSGKIETRRANEAALSAWCSGG